MVKSRDIFDWTRKLECPPTICNDLVKKVLLQGVAGLLWEDLANVIYTAKEVETIRKNILLYHLKTGTPNKIIQCAKTLTDLKSKRKTLKSQISELEKEYDQQDYLVRQKLHKLRNISSKRTEVQAKRDLLKMKYKQTATQLRDCNDMRLVCQHLKPSTCKELDSKVLNETLQAVTSPWTGANKREVLDTVSRNLNNIEVPTLWFHIYQNLTEDVDALITLESMKPLDTKNQVIDVSIAKLCGQHIYMVSKQLFHHASATNYQQNVLEFIEKVEVASNNFVDVSEWLELALEVRKLETEQISLQKEIERIRDEVHQNNTFVFDLAQLTAEIQNIDSEIVEYMQNIQQSVSLLKSMPKLLIKSKEKLCSELQSIVALRRKGYDSEWFSDDLSIELDIFHDNFNINALRKIMLKGDIGVYRHTKCCFSEAALLVNPPQISNLVPYFPMIQTPIYSLIEYYKYLISMLVYKKFESLEIEETSQMIQLPKLTCEENKYNTIDLLNLSKVVNTKTKTEIDEFYEVLNAWIHQPVQRLMGIIEKTVDDATFSDWIKRHDVLLYMLNNATQ